MIRRLIGAVLKLIGALTVLAALCATAALLLLGSWLQYETPLEKADYIVPLAGDDHRLLKAVELYKAGYAPKILLGYDQPLPPARMDEIAAKLGRPRVQPQEWRQKILAYLEVPAAAIVEYSSGHISTVEEAEAVRHYVGDKPVRIIVVTSPYHSRRAKIIFESILPHAKLMFASPPEGALSNPWWADQKSAIAAVIESTKVVYFWLGGAFRKAAADRAP